MRVCCLRCGHILILSFLFCTLWPARAPAQFLPRHGDVRLHTMHYRNSGGEQGRTDFFYGRDGVLRSALWRLNDNSRCSANYHLYDGAGLEVEKYREFSDGLTSTEIYQYDKQGRRGRERFSRSDGTAGEVIFLWDEEGRLAVADCRQYKGWFTGLVEYSHAAGRLSGAKILREGEPIGAIEYDYDPSGRLNAETWRIDGQWSQTFSYEYEPVPRVVWSASSPLQMMNTGYRTVMESYDYNGEGGGPSSYSYDETGRLLEKTFTRADGLQTVTSYRFDERGSLISSHRRYSSGLTAEFSYRFDGALRLVEKTFRRSDGAEGRERYRYDRLGRLVATEYRNMDFWLNGLITYTYDKRGYLAAGHFMSEDGRDAELRLSTDTHGNVVRVHWAFTGDATQTYTFEYAATGCGAMP